LLVLLEGFQLSLVLTPTGAGDPKKPEEEEAPPLKRLEGVAAREAPPKENVGPPGVEPANSDELPYGVADGVAGFEGAEAPPKLKPDAGVDGANVFMVDEPHVTMVVEQE